MCGRWVCNHFLAHTLPDTQEKCTRNPSNGIFTTVINGVNLYLVFSNTRISGRQARIQMLPWCSSIERVENISPKKESRNHKQ